MRGIVWGNTRKAANRRLDKLINEYKKLWQFDTLLVRKGRNEYVVHFENGDIWQAIVCHENARGRRCHIAMIDRTIPIEKVNLIIKPCLCPPFRGIAFFNPKEEI